MYILIIRQGNIYLEHFTSEKYNFKRKSIKTSGVGMRLPSSLLLGFILTCTTLFSSDVLCIGNALVDTFAFISEEALAKVNVERGGEAPVSTLSFEKEILSLTAEQKKFTGGSAANTAKGLGRLGCSVSLFACIGNDEAGQFIQSVMKENHVLQCVPPQLGTTSRVLCLITPDSQRSFLFCGGTSGCSSPKDLKEIDFQSAKIVHHDGYILRNKPLLETSLYLCKKWRAQTSLDLGAFPIVRENKTYLLQKILPEIDILIGNSDEMHALFGSDQEINNALLERRSLSIHLKGADGCCIYERGRKLSIPTMSQTAIDSTGAGDLFISGFLYGLIQGWNLERSAALGHRLAGVVIKHIGAEIPSHDWPKIISTF